jgi:hypothetical protein
MNRPQYLFRRFHCGLSLRLEQALRSRFASNWAQGLVCEASCE